MSFPVDKPADISVSAGGNLLMVDQLRGWNPYLAGSIVLFAETVDGVVEVSLYDPALHNRVGMYTRHRVFPSECIANVHYEVQTTITFSSMHARVRDWIKLNIDYWNASKRNDIRSPLPVPVDVSLLPLRYPEFGG